MTTDNLRKSPLSEKEINKIKSLQTDWDVKTDEKEIDKGVYGTVR